MPIKVHYEYFISLMKCLGLYFHVAGTSEPFFFFDGGLGAFFFLWGGYNFLDFILFKTFCVSLIKWGGGGL